MEIDWFTIGAQILNFLVLVWLLKRFLYQPVLDAIDQREQRIAKALREAAESKTQAASERAELQAKGEAFDAQRAELLAKAVAEAADERQRLSVAARAAVDDLKQQQSAALARDAKTLSAEIRRRAEAEVFDIARKALADMADVALEERMTGLFIARFAALQGAEKSAVANLLTSSSEPAVIRSAFALSKQQQAAIVSAIKAVFDVMSNPHFEVAPDLVSGIELVGGGQKLAWSLSDYLKTLEKSVAGLLSSQGAGAGGVA